MASALDVIQVVVEGALLAQRIMSVYQFITAEAVTDSEAIGDLYDRVASDLYGTLTAQLANNYVITNLEFKNLTENELMDVLPYEGDPFTHVGELLPLGVAALVTANTGTPKVRGRKFIPALTEGNCDDSLWAPALVTALTNFANVYVSGFLGVESASPYAPGVLDKNGVFRPFSEAIVSNIPAYQRRRKQGVGE